MKLYTLSLSLFLSISPLLGSDYLTLEQQNEKMRRAFNRNEKTITINNTQAQNSLNELAQQIFPHHVQSLASNHSSSVMTLDDWEKTRKHAAETMFHRLNDALNFLLTNREIILSAISRNPEFIGLTCYTVGQDEQGKLYFLIT
jgi:pyoverdine/dityrosine biosynthesis protein Dit1